MSGTKEKKLNLPQSLLLLLLIIVSVAVCIRLKTGGPMIGLFASWIFIYLFCKIFGISYANIVAGAYDAIRMVVPTLCLLMAIGVMIGTWLQSGTIATIISWGLKMINPSWLLPLTLLFCSILSIVTGTSYGSVGSAGVAMMAIGNAMGIHPGMVAGAVICGAMFGDKLSPLSDTTNLAPAVADAKLGDHIRSMLWTTLPTYVITLILFTILGFQQTSGSYTEGSITVYIDALNDEFQLGWITMIPAILIIVLLLCKVNAISALGLSSFAAGFVSYFVQHDTLQDIIRTAYNGYTTAIEEPVLQSILNRGGMGSMLQYVAIICFAVGMGGMLEKLGVLDHILQAIVKRINSDGSMILATMIVGYVTSLISCSQPMAHVLTGRLMAPVFQERKVAPEILSRCLEDSGTMAGPMIPWHGYGVYMAGTPNACPNANGPSSAVVVGDRAYLVDFGPGVVRQASAAYFNGVDALRPDLLTVAFCTHLHTDHTAGYPDLIFTPWVLERPVPLKVFGPKGLQHMTDHILQAYETDIDFRIHGFEKANESGYRVEVTEIESGIVYRDDLVTVEAFPVSHGTLECYGYKFTTPDRTIVITGDTAPLDLVAEKSKGCDILLHEVEYAAGISCREPKWQKYHREVHTLSTDLAGVAKKANPKLLVTYHRIYHMNVQDNHKNLAAEMAWRDAAILDEIRDAGYDGYVVNGKDLDVF